MCTERNAEDQVLTIDESSVYQPPSQLQLPSEEVPVSNSDSAVSGPESDDNSSDNSDLLLSPGPRYADEESPKKPEKPAVAAAQMDDQRAQAEQKQVNSWFFCHCSELQNNIVEQSFMKKRWQGSQLS